MITIANRKIGQDYKPFIIAEMSGNHNQSLERAMTIVEEAAKAGAHAIKLQTYTADTMTMDVETDEFLITDPQSLWRGNTLHNLYQQAYTPWEWHRPIFEKASQLGILAFSTPFDESSVDFLEELNVPVYKIASFENTDIPLIEKVASTGKPIIISTGMATLADISEAVAAIRKFDVEDIILLKCTSSYPSSPHDSNIITIPHLREAFGAEVGLSDHTMGIGAAIASVALGASVIEKHFTLRRSDGGVDSAFSIEPDELKRLVIESERAWQALGNVRYGPTDVEIKSMAFRRSIYITKDLNKGEMLTRDNIKIIRPGYGLAPKFYPHLLGKHINCDVKRGQPTSWSIIG